MTDFSSAISRSSFTSAFVGTLDIGHAGIEPETGRFVQRMARRGDAVSVGCENFAATDSRLGLVQREHAGRVLVFNEDPVAGKHRVGISDGVGHLDLSHLRK